MRGKLVWCVAFVAALVWLTPQVDAESIKIGSTKIASGGPVFIAMDKGYFAEEGLEAQMVFFAASLPVAVATVSGDIDFGSAGLTAALYQLRRPGPLPLIAAHSG